MLTRREVLAALSGALAAGAASDRIVLQTYIWQQRFRERGAAELFATARRAGYTQLELMPAFLEPDVSTLLSQHGLRPTIIYSGGVMHEPEAAKKTIAQAMQNAVKAKTLGALAMNFNQNPKPGKARKSDGELATQAKCIGELATEVHKLGLRFFSHNHDAEMIDNAREWRHILAHTDPKVVSICLDVDWVSQGGQDPLELMDKAGQRLASLHIRNAKNKVWLEAVGEGDVDYRQVAARSKQAEPWLVVELAYNPDTEITRGIDENLRRSREFVERVFSGKS